MTTPLIFKLNFNEKVFLASVEQVQQLRDLVGSMTRVTFEYPSYDMKPNPTPKDNEEFVKVELLAPTTLAKFVVTHGADSLPE